ncbi:uncharacterized protein LOC6573159 isoform X2 [Drosophila mojavensis]|uniref:Uncharacterized protein, isoform A n=1 Tax=Drosophila mojavensis TaxID=7230 RepID=B4KBN4_DROMO|nr:uncharacterized protein LOC6573159 isoform X2 [Drosophila mojavensis]EDW14711.2 uncharacterized protein Dmoj_GI24407, isoform A [Drosophila mojavensis]
MQESALSSRHRNWPTGESPCTSSTTKSTPKHRIRNHSNMANKCSNWLHWLLLLSSALLCLSVAKANESGLSTTPLTPDVTTETATTTATGTPPESAAAPTAAASTFTPSALTTEDRRPIVNATRAPTTRKLPNGNDSLLLRIARRFSSGNELWDGLIRECYLKPDMSCFQKNVYSYLNSALDIQDVNITQRLKFYRNKVQYDAEQEEATNEARSASPETPIEEVSNALYGKTIKFAMTHDMELDLPEIVFNGATFRISPRSIEGNGIIAKLELIPKQLVKARLAGAMIKKKINKFLRNKLLLSFIALVLIIKIIKIKLFWLLPIVIGVGAAKKLLLKFLLFLFPALSHLFKLCSYYQQPYHGTKYHHHHHLINHHHTVVPPWHSGEHHSVPEIIYTHPPKGHPSAYLHGAPVHEIYGPGPGHEHFEGAWENSGPGLGSEYISAMKRDAQVGDNANYFKPHTANDANELQSWGLGTTQPYTKQPSPQQQQQQQQQQQRWQNNQQQQQISFQQKAQASSHSLNKFHNLDKQSSRPAFAQHNPVYVAAPGAGAGVGPGPGPGPGHGHGPSLTAAAQIAAQYEPARNNNQQQQQQQQQQLSPELAAQLKEAIRIQAEKRLIQQQQQILEHQPFVQDGQPLYPLNYDPFYSPILLKIDKIIEQMGIKSDLCKERVVCSMYKDPATYSPHSNFISAELSRETSELEPVTHANEAVRRFYRLIQAARDGQDQKDCLSLYPQCNMPAK